MDDLAAVFGWWFYLESRKQGENVAAEREARIVIESRPDGRKGLSIVDPRTGRRNNTGLTALPGEDLDQKVRHLKTSLERSGSRVTVIGG